MCIHFLALISFEKKNMEDGITNGMPDFKEDENPFVFLKGTEEEIGSGTIFSPYRKNRKAGTNYALQASLTLSLEL